MDKPPADTAARHDRAVARELALLGLPPAAWPATVTGPDGAPMLDVAILGAGMCGIAAAAALMLQGVRRVRLIDRAPRGVEGPWLTTARMRHLRSPKHLPGVAPMLPGLTFRAWYESRFGEAGWEALYKISNAEWADYLGWLVEVLGLDVASGVEVADIVPQGPHLRLEIAGGAPVHARRVVLATGRLGAGGLAIPSFVSRDLWPDRAAHAAEAIDFASLAGRRVVVLGTGASGWDNAATALEAGAASVVMLGRRAHLPQVNKSRGASHPGFYDGHWALPAAEKWRLATWLGQLAGPPPHESVHRALAHPGFSLRQGVATTAVRRDGDGVAVELTGEVLRADFLICATGFRVDLAARPELASLGPHIATWADRHAGATGDLGRFPWLAEDFALTPRDAAAAAALRHVYAFNHAATLSLGAIASDIPGVPAGAGRLARGITASLFREDFPALLDGLSAFAEPELAGTPFFEPDVPGREPKP